MSQSQSGALGNSRPVSVPGSGALFLQFADATSFSRSQVREPMNDEVVEDQEEGNDLGRDMDNVFVHSKDYR